MTHAIHIPNARGVPGGLRRAVGCALVALAAAGCGPRSAHPWREPATPLVWPPPPSPGRIRHEGTLASGELRWFRGGWRGVLDAVFGGPKLSIGTPHGVAADADVLAVADSGRGLVHLLDLQRRRYRAVAAAGKAVLRCPIGVALDGAGGVFVSDSALARVFRLSLRGEVLGEVETPWVRPTGIAYDRRRRLLHVVDTGVHAVRVFAVEPSGFRLVRTLGARGEGRGSFNFPTHVALGPDGTAYVTDSLNHRVQIFGPDGRLTGSFGQAGDGTGDFAKAKGVALDARGHVYVVDSLYDVVQVFDQSGRFLLAFGGSGRTAGGRPDGLLWLPTGIVIGHEDRIYVADSGNSRIQVYRYVHPDR